MFSSSQHVPVARELMSKKTRTLSPTLSVTEGLTQLITQQHSGMPVVDSAGSYIGVFSEKCCLRALRDTATMQRWANVSIRDSGAMATKLFCLTPDEDAIQAIGGLIKHKVSGAPVTDKDHTFRGMFSEKTSMRVLIGAAYDSLPSATVAAFMDTDRSRLIDEQTPLAAIARTFTDTPFRRLPVIRDNKVVGLVNRGNLLKTRVELPNATVADFVDRAARTVSPEDDMLTIAEVFQTTPYRRLPVLDGGQLVGIVSRRDILNCAYHLMDPPAESHSNFLYISAVDEQGSKRVG